MGIKDVKGISRPGMFETITDKFGNKYTPKSGRGGSTNVSVNGSRETVPIRSSDPDSARWRAEEQGLIEPEYAMGCLAMAPIKRGRK